MWWCSRGSAEHTRTKQLARDKKPEKDNMPEDVVIGTKRITDSPQMLQKCDGFIALVPPAPTDMLPELIDLKGGKSEAEVSFHPETAH